MSDQGSSGSGHVLADSQFGLLQVLRPVDDFETVYQARPAGIPIAFPGGLDDEAGDPLVADNLQKGLSVPMGAEVLLWVPFCAAYDGVTTQTELYEYQVIWRIRNIRDFRTARKPYHFPVQAAGVPDTSVVPAESRSIIPAADWSAARQAPPVAPTEIGTTQAQYYSDRLVPRAGGITSSPLDASGSATALTQGLFDPAVETGVADDPIFVPMYLGRAAGDEMIILARRVNEGAGPWDFASASDLDFPFSNVYGTRDGARTPREHVGIYVMTGTNGQSTVLRAEYLASPASYDSVASCEV